MLSVNCFLLHIIYPSPEISTCPKETLPVQRTGGRFSRKSCHLLWSVVSGQLSVSGVSHLQSGQYCGQGEEVSGQCPTEWGQVSGHLSKWTFTDPLHWSVSVS